MPTAKRSPQPRSHPGPTIFVLFGATGDLAKRLVLPAFYRLATEGLLPKRVAAGRQRPRRRRARGLPRPRPRRADRVRPEARAQRRGSIRRALFFAGGGFNTDDPGSLLDVLGQGAQAARRRPAARPLPGRAAGRLRRADQGAGPARPGQGRPRGLREAVRHLTGELPRAGPGRPLGPRRAAGVPDRPFPRQGGHPGPARAAVRQRAVRRVLGSRAHRVGPDRRARRSSASPTGRCSTTPPARCSTCWSPTCSRSRPRWPWSRRPAWARSTCSPPGKR